MKRPIFNSFIQQFPSRLESTLDFSVHNNSSHTGMKNNISEDLGTSLLLLTFCSNYIPHADIFIFLSDSHAGHTPLP